MANLKKVLAGTLGLCMAASMLTACGDSDSSSSSDSKAAAKKGGSGISESKDRVNTAELHGKDSSEESKNTVKIYCWNTEFKSRLDTYYEKGADALPVEKDADGSITSIDGKKIEWVQIENEGNAYQTKLDEALKGQGDSDDKVDMFLMEADYALKYANGDVALSVQDLGLTADDMSEMYQYTKDVATDTATGELKGVSWQATPGLFMYNRNYAKEVLGSDDPATVQEAVKDWDAFTDTAAKMKEKGIFMVSGFDDTYRCFSNNVSAPWVDADGKVTAKGAGSARITVKTSKGETAVCIVTVTEPIIYAETVKFDKSEISVESGKTVKLKAEILPFDTTDASLTWSSSNNAVVTVTDGIVTARAAGAAAITAVTSNGKAASCVVFVTEPVVEPETIVMNKTSLYLKKGTKQQIKAVIAPENVTDKTVTWTTSDRSIATVSNGMITAQSPGIVTIKATSCNGLSASCTVIVYTTLIEAESVSMNREEITIKKGTKFQLKSIFTPADTTNKTVDWITSDKSIATVSNGRVTAQSVGKAVITVKTSNGKTAVCYVTVI